MIPPDALVFGLTGAFGSGCSTLARVLAEERGFTDTKISDLIIEAWHALPREERGDHDRPPRGALQDLGDDLRRATERYAYWVELAVSRVADADATVTRFVIDGIRNPSEIEWLRERFKNAFIIAVDAPPDERWERLRQTPAWKGRHRSDFDTVSNRDQEAPEQYGQRVQQCTDLADFVITNDESFTPNRASHHLLSRADDLIALTEDSSIRRPTDDETFLHMAYASAMRSACLKRNVGAVIVQGTMVTGSRAQPPADTRFRLQVAGVGYNENPDNMRPCVEEFRTCYRDLWRDAEMKSRGFTSCPYCNHSLEGTAWPYRCQNPDCSSGGSLLEAFFPDRAMSHCTAIHAEVRAIRNAGSADLSGSTVYTTTFPCFLCALQLLQAGISRVVYVEPYPDSHARDLLTKNGVEVDRFHGVKSLAFTRLFGNWRANAEQEYAYDPS